MILTFSELNCIRVHIARNARKLMIPTIDAVLHKFKIFELPCAQLQARISLCKAASLPK